MKYKFSETILYTCPKKILAKEDVKNLGRVISTLIVAQLLLIFILIKFERVQPAPQPATQRRFSNNKFRAANRYLSSSQQPNCCRI